MSDFLIPMQDGTELVGRTIKNAFGFDEIVRLPEAWWSYFDWCSENLDYDMNEWVQYMDKIRPSDVSFDLHLWRSLWEHECRRYFHGYPCQTKTTPLGYTDFVEAIEKEENCPKRHEWKTRTLIDSKDDEVQVEMQAKFWQHFDYLVGLGGDMEKWVVNADIAREETQKSLSEELMNSLIRYERKNYIEHGKMPLFISLKGYPRPRKSN